VIVGRRNVGNDPVQCHPIGRSIVGDEPVSRDRIYGMGDYRAADLS
jgi:hypothetical protein